MEQCYSMVFSWMMQNLEVYLQPIISSVEMKIVILGTQIPKWFDKQNGSRSISMDPSAVIDNPNWIGVALCVLFVTHEDPMNLGERYHYPEMFYSREQFIHLLSRDPNTMHDLHGVQFETIVVSQPQGLRVVVKNCGYRWVILKDDPDMDPNDLSSIVEHLDKVVVDYQTPVKAGRDDSNAMVKLHDMLMDVSWWK
ncbi:hypothetical protein VNO80_25453 [Phaseolus coccineus]|uniref:C-JID domain-containing protein n=1 Tax=Phaseolus coccineus TaxID=3886 RepID=A0AAN9QTD7_PHACN